MALHGCTVSSYVATVRSTRIVQLHLHKCVEDSILIYNLHTYVQVHMYKHIQSVYTLTTLGSTRINNLAFYHQCVTLVCTCTIHWNWKLTKLLSVGLIIRIFHSIPEDFDSISIFYFVLLSPRSDLYYLRGQKV